jgi:bacterioferritin
MQAPPAIIAMLNKMLFNELTAINQYFLHARILRHWGFKALGEKIYHESIGEMKHADRLTERILVLDGLPNFQDHGKLHIGENVLEILNLDLKLEMTARDDTAKAIAFFETEQDFVSREIATKILVDSEDHIDYLETQISLAQKMGEPNYLQSAAGELEEDA